MTDPPAMQDLARFDDRIRALEQRSYDDLRKLLELEKRLEHIETKIKETPA